jgi:hypothetical protein
VSTWWRFLLALGLTCGGGYAAIYVFGMSPSYCAHSRSYADAAPCYKYDVRRVNTAALLIGDSSLLYAIRPSLVEQESGVSSYNYGLVGPAFAFDPEAVIDHYLATNARPQIIVVYISPWTRIEPYVITDPVWFPIAVLTLQHGTWKDYLRLFRARPSAIAEIPPTIVRSVGLSSASGNKWRTQMSNDGGHLDYAATLYSEQQDLSGHCGQSVTLSAKSYAVINEMAISALRRHYETEGFSFYFYVAPTAKCDGKIDQLRAAYTGVADNLPMALPDKYFANEPSAVGHVHVNADGVVAASNLFAAFLDIKHGLDSKNTAR